MWISELRYQDPRTRTYLGSPSLLRLADGTILATHDYFGPGCPRNMEREEHLLSVYRSEDDGRTWRNLTHVSGAYWSGLFSHGGATWLIGVSAQYGDIVIRRSDDGGFTWTFPADEASGLLFRGGPYHAPPNYHCAPVPVLVAKGRIWRAFEDNDPLHWPHGFQSCVVSAPIDADLLRAASWTMTNMLAYDQDVDPPEFGAGNSNGSGWLEGNIVEAPDGQLWNILRVHSAPVLDKAAMARVSDDGRTLSFDPATGFIDLPGGMTKFVIRRDPKTGVFWLMANDMQDAPYPVRRNRLSLFMSPDLRSWTRRKVLLEDNLEADPLRSAQHTGFQYPDWHFDRDDLIYLVRTAYDGAHNFHDANRITFGRVKGFRRLLGDARGD